MGGDRQILLAALIAAAGAAGAGAVVLALDGSLWPAAAVAATAGLALAGGATVLGHHFAQLRSLEAAIAGLPSTAPPSAITEARGEVARIYATAAALVRPVAGAPAERLATIVAALPLPVVAMTETGLVSLANGPARLLLGEAAAMVGTSLFDALHRTPLAAAQAASREAGRPVEATLETVTGRSLAARVVDLGLHGGALIVFAAPAEDWAPGLDHALDLHDDAAAGAIGPDSALAHLPAVALDTETTGLDPRTDRIVAIGAVRMTGGRLRRAETFDRLVRPGVAIPARSTAIHGIGDAMVADAPTLAGVLPDLQAFVAGRVAIGHNIGFDLATLGAEAARAGIDWSPPSWLCTLQLAAALDPARTHLDLSDVAEAHGIAVTGRHTALGDALVNAELFAALLPRLAAQGVTTLGEATAFAAQAKRVRRRQAEAGW